MGFAPVNGNSPHTFLHSINIIQHSSKDKSEMYDNSFLGNFFSVLFCILGSYLIGAIPWGYIIGKCHGIDIREHGSGNIGATNVTRTIGKGWGKLCFFLDLLKGMLPVCIVSALLASTPENASIIVKPFLHLLKDIQILQDKAGILPCLAGLAAVFGHVWPIFLKFKGGKGVSTAAGAMIALNPFALVSAGAVWAIVFFIGRYVSLASILAAISMPIFCILYKVLGVAPAQKPEIFLFLALAILAVMKHSSNIRRLLAGTESRFDRKNKGEEPGVEDVQPLPRIKAAVLGDGAWGTALALTLHKNGHNVSVWGAFASNIDHVNQVHENDAFLKGPKIPEDMVFTSDMKAAVDGADIIVLATPSQYLRGVLKQLKDNLNPNQIIVDIAKGIETGTLLTMSELCREELGPTRYVALSGPSHAEEVAIGIPTLVVTASADVENAKFVQKAFMNEYFRVYTCQDVIGAELGGALKNIYAIAAGILDGLGMGDNTKAALMTRAIAEMSRLGKRLGGKVETFSGLSGVGDLIVTCMSKHSRNRFVGEELGKGRKLDDIIKSMNMVVAEGVKTCEAAYALAKRCNVDTPLINGIYSVLHDNSDPKEIAHQLMTRKARREDE